MRQHTFKRAAALLLVLALLCALLPQTAPAVRAAGYSGSCGEELTWTFRPKTGVLTIEGEGEMWNFWGGDRGDGSNNPVPWGSLLDRITGLELPEGLTSVGDNAFMDCLHLQSAVIPETVTYIGWNAFRSCTDLSEIVLSEGVTEIGAYSFSACTGLSEVVLPSRLVTVYDEAFASCTGLTAVTFLNPCCSIPEDCLTGCGALTVFGYDGSTAQAFAGEQGFPFSSLGDFTAEGVCGDDLTWSLNSGTGVLTIVGGGDLWSFWGSKGDGFISSNTEPWNAYRSIITGLELPEGLTSIGDVAFNGCWRLESAVIPETVTRIGEYAFGACDGLREVEIPEGVSTIAASAFEFCTSLPLVVLPASVELVEEYAFCACFSLDSITFLNPSCVIADDCLDCTENQIIYGYSGSTAETYAAEHGLFFLPLGEIPTEGVCGSNLTWRFDPDTGTLTIEGSGCMDDYEELYAVPWDSFRSDITAISLPDWLIDISSWAFADCTGLSAVTIPEHTQYIGTGAFRGCTGLTELTIPDGVYSLSDASFGDCTGLQSVVLSENLEYLTGFNGCTGLRKITIPDHVSTIDASAFEGCTGLTELTFGSGVSTIDSDAFADCTGLRSLELPDSLTYLSGFAGCTGLSSLSIPEGVTRVGWRAFAGCTGLTAAAISETVQTIDESAFQGCTGLREVTLPASLVELDAYAFSNCRNLRSLTFLCPLCSIDWDCLANSNRVTIYGYTDSTAESFAEDHGYPFVSIGSGDFSGPCGDDLTWTYAPKTGVLSIEGTGDMWNYWSEDGPYLEIPWYAVASEITELRLGEGMTSIGEFAFVECTGLSSVTVPSTVTRIGDQAFDDCSGLVSVELPEGLIYCSGFAYCCNLAEVTIPSTVTVLGNKAFCSCESLTEIEIPDGVTHIYWAAFRDCYGLTEVTLPDSLIEVDWEVFGRCYGLTEITFPASVTTVGFYALEDCTGLTAVTFLNPICNIGYGCLEGNSWATVYGYSGSTAEILAEENGNPFVSLGTAEMGGPCGDNLTWIYEPETRTLIIRGSGAMWDFGYSDEYYFEVENPIYVPWEPFCDVLTGVVIEEGVTTIGRSAFSECGSLSNVSISGTVRSIGPFAFEACYALTEVTIPGSVSSVGSYAFLNCEALRSLTVQEGVQSFGEAAFLGCGMLSSVTLPESLVSIGIDAFEYCYSLRQLVIRNPDCRVCAYEKATTRGIWYSEYDTPNTLGMPGQTVIFGLHDPEKEDAEMMMENAGNQLAYVLYGFRYAENYAKTCGYTFYALGVFDDVRPGKWYEIPVAWAYGMGITSGTGEGTFSPNDTCTREQIVTFLYAAAGRPDYSLTENPFTDVKAGKWYYDAVMWAYENGITSGVGDGLFGVGLGCTRAQVVSFLWNALGSPEPASLDCPFEDVAPGKYYYKPVLWAVENGITSGTGPNTFSPKDICTRAQIVTFLYKAYVG